MDSQRSTNSHVEATPERFTFNLAQADPIPQSGIDRANILMESGQLFRYGELDDHGTNDAADLETGFARLIGRRYAVAVNSCGSAMYLALRASGVQPGSKVLMNGYTLAPVPGAIDHAGAVPAFVEVSEDLTIDLDDLRHKARLTGARTLLLSHMRGHVPDMEAVVATCRELGLSLIEDCAHTLGAKWDGRPTGQFGVVGCFSTQSFKHINSGEGGVLVTDDDEIAARAILHSGSYMLYEQHQARPPLQVLERFRAHVPNYSLRMSALAAATALPQLTLLPQRVEKMNRLYRTLANEMTSIPEVRLIKRPKKEQFVGSSFQFALPHLNADQISTVVATANQFGLHLKWFGERTMQGFTSRPEQWEWAKTATQLPQTERILAILCELRLPPSMPIGQCRLASSIIRFSIDQAKGALPAQSSTRNLTTTWRPQTDVSD